MPVLPRSLSHIGRHSCLLLCAAARPRAGRRLTEADADRDPFGTHAADRPARAHPGAVLLAGRGLSIVLSAMQALAAGACRAPGAAKPATSGPAFMRAAFPRRLARQVAGLQPSTSRKDVRQGPPRVIERENTRRHPATRRRCEPGVCRFSLPRVPTASAVYTAEHDS
jgi:hypothetical protein